MIEAGFWLMIAAGLRTIMEWNDNGMNNDVWMNVILARMNRLLLEQTTCGNKLKQERMIGEIKDWLSG